MQTRNGAKCRPAGLTGRIGWARCEIKYCVIILVSKVAVVAKMVNLETSNLFGSSKIGRLGFLNGLLHSVYLAPPVDGAVVALKTTHCVS